MADKAAKNAHNSLGSEIILFSSLVDIKRNINKYCIVLWLGGGGMENEFGK